MPVSPNSTFFNNQPDINKIREFILQNKGELTTEDHAFIDAIVAQERFHPRSLKSESYYRIHGHEKEIPTEVTGLWYMTTDIPWQLKPEYKTIPTIESTHLDDYKRTQLFAYLHNNRFVLCSEFVSIPLVAKYLAKLQMDLTTYASYSYRHYPELENDHHDISPQIHLETLLLSCLTAEVKSFDFIPFVAQACVSNIPPQVRSVADMYELSKLYVNQFLEQIDSKLISQFYDCYISYLSKKPIKDQKKIDELKTEKEINFKISEEREIENSKILTRSQLKSACKNYVAYKDQWLGLRWLRSSDKSYDTLLALDTANDDHQRYVIAKTYINKYPNKAFARALAQVIQSDDVKLDTRAAKRS